MGSSDRLVSALVGMGYNKILVTSAMDQGCTDADAIVEYIEGLDDSDGSDDDCSLSEHPPPHTTDKPADKRRRVNEPEAPELAQTAPVPLMDPEAHGLRRHVPHGSVMIPFADDALDLWFTVRSAASCSAQQYLEWHVMGPSELDGSIVSIRENIRIRARKSGPKTVEIAAHCFHCSFRECFQRAFESLCSIQDDFTVTFVGWF